MEIFIQLNFKVIKIQAVYQRKSIFLDTKVKRANLDTHVKKIALGQASLFFSQHYNPYLIRISVFSVMVILYPKRRKPCQNQGRNRSA